MEAVGYDLYCKLLNEAIMVLKGGQEAGDFETSIDLPVDAFIPDDYIASETVKMEIYKRISGIGSEEDLFDVTDELIDRFGQIPAPVENLLSVAYIRASAHRVFMTDVALKGRLLTMKMFPRALAHAEALWSDPQPRDFECFAKRATAHRLRLLSLGINCSPLAPDR